MVQTEHPIVHSPLINCSCTTAYAQQDCCIRLEQQHLALTTAHAIAIEGERLANATALSQALESQRQSSAALDEIMAELASLRCVQETGLPAVLMAEFAKLKVSG